MTALPITATLGLRRYSVTVDRYGDEVEGWADPVDWPVHGIAPGAMDEPWSPERDLSHIEWTVYAPIDGPVPHERDRVVVDGVEFNIDGRPSDWTRGPWDHPTAGLVVLLTRKEG